MSDELPIVIAPDGAVIQLTVIRMPGQCCEQCHMAELYCNHHHSADTAKLLGVNCNDYDPHDFGNELAIWQEVKDE
jgi:hypothetical protein